MSPLLMADLKMDGLLVPATSSVGVGREADRVSSMIAEICLQLRDSVSVRRTAEEAGNAIWEALRSTEHEFDPEAVSRALEFLRALPSTAPAPTDVEIDPDGEVDLTWRRDASHVLSVSVGPTGRLTFASIAGSANTRGTEYFSDDIPATIVRALSRVLSPLGA